MISMRRIIGIFVLLLIVTIIGVGGGLTKEQLSKIHPGLQSAISKPSPAMQTDKKVMGGRVEAVSVKNNEPVYSVIVFTKDADELRSNGIQVNSVLPDFVTAEVTKADITRMASLPGVRFIDPGSRNYPQLEVSVPETGASLLHGGFINSTPYKGNGAIVLIYDTGIDWKHMDFRKPADTTKSRILFIWDQTLTPTGGETSPTEPGLGYGVQYTQTQIENELDGTPVGFVREMDINGHGTHVASTAAGNGKSYNDKYVGIAPEADIIVVKGGDGSFSESRMIDCLTYAEAKATALSKPVVINWSIGGQYGPHDGTRSYEVAVDTFVSNPGRAVCISAGNDGDLMMHVQGNVTSVNPDSVMFTIPSYTQNPGTFNDYVDLDIWIRDGSNVTATVTSPSGYSYSFPSQTELTATDSTHGTIYVYNWTSGLNGNREIFVEVYDGNTHPPEAGTWKVKLTKTTSGSTYDAWLPGSDLGGYGAALVNGDNSKTVSMPGTSNGAITSGAYCSKFYWTNYSGSQYSFVGANPEADIAVFSSVGPTADNRTKPDIASPGTSIGAALSTGVTSPTSALVLPGQKHQIMQGTSMASPHTTGAVALLLGAHPTLTAADIKDLITTTADGDSYASGLPNFIWGFGKLDVLESMAKSYSGSAVVTRTTLAYDGGTSSTIMPALTGSLRQAVRFSPTVSGKLTGIKVNITTQGNRPIVGSGTLDCRVYADNAGLPSGMIGSTVSQPLGKLSPGTNNYIQMIDAGVDVTAGTDYHIVIGVSNPSDTIKIRGESAAGTRSSSFNGSTWSAVTTYNYRIRSIVTTTSGLGDVPDGGPAGQPLVYRLNKNFPNPFNPSTTISYEIPIRGIVKLQVFDILGRLVTTLVNSMQEAGPHQITWQGKSGNGAAISSGIYFYRLQSGNFSQTERMLLLK